MSRKWRDRAAGKIEPKPPSAADAVRQRRRRRLIFVGLIGLSFPILEVIAYRYRAITMSFDNRSNNAITNLKVTYPGGSIEEAEIKPGGEITRVTRPDFTFEGKDFSTYPVLISFATADGTFIRQRGRAGALDFSAHEQYVIQEIPTTGQVQVQHTTSPGFPLGTIRDLLKALGIG